MANLHNMKNNRWWPYCAHLGDNKDRYSRDDLVLRVISLMEMAYASGSSEAKRKTDHEKMARGLAEREI